MTQNAPKTGLALLRSQEWVEAYSWHRYTIGGDQGIRQDLFELHYDFARQMARNYYYRRRNAGVEIAELEQIACEALLRAIERYDPHQRSSFRAFSRRRIAGHLADSVAGMTEVNRQISVRYRVERERIKSLSQNDTAGETSALEKLTALVSGLALGLMLEGTGIYAGDGEAECQPSAYDSLAWKEAVQKLTAEVDRLQKSQAMVLRQHYENGLSFAHIAELLGLSRGRISQLHREALHTLRKRIGKF